MVEDTQGFVAICNATYQACDNSARFDLPKNLLVKCHRCRDLLYVRDWERNLKVCRSCGYHFRLSAVERIANLFDVGSFVEVDERLKSTDPLRFISKSCTYTDKLVEEQKRTGLNEAVVIGTGSIGQHPLALAVMDFHFIGGSMGVVVGEKIARIIELACEKRFPLLIVSASGGARMHEGVLSLMQMAKTSVALTRLSEAQLPFVSLLTDPTTGGVTASFAMQGDVILAEPGAFVGFAGPRVIEQFMHQKLPTNVNTSEFMLEHGLIDAVVPRYLLRSTIAQFLDYYKTHPQRIFEGKHFAVNQERRSAISLPRRKPALKVEMQQQTVTRPLLSAWDQVQLARHKDRPHTTDYIRMMCKNFFELRGDRRYADDPAIVGGLATFVDRTIMLIGHQKGRSIGQRQGCRSGMPHPEGYRKAQRLMRLGEKFGFPVVCMIDTPGAYPGIEAEQRGQAQAIAEGLEIMTTLRVPIVAIVIGEGGSGGALALGLADRILMLEHSIYTVASPEAAASILWRNNKLAAQAAEAMHITAPDLLNLGVIDGIIPEPEGGAHLNHMTSMQFLAKQLRVVLTELAKIPVGDLLEQRYIKFRNPEYFSCG